MSAEAKSSPNPGGAATENEPRGRAWQWLGQRVRAFMLVLAFAGVQYVWFRDGVRYNWWLRPSPVLGPLYFLANEDPSDDWIGCFLLLALTPPLIALVAWPARQTWILALATMLVWISPGLFTIWTHLP